jgi:hypothetical protein
MSDDRGETTPDLEVARALAETQSLPVRTIGLLIDLLGVEATWELVREAEAIHAGEGMLIANGTRKRTLGGCFFELARRNISDEDRLRIFEKPRQRQLERQRRRKERAQSAAQAAATVPKHWVVELVHVPSGKSSDAAAPRILEVARAALQPCSSDREAIEMGKKAVASALAKLYGSRLKSMQPPKIVVRAVPDRSER